MLKLYTSHCPMCNMLSKMMDNKKMLYEVVDNPCVYLPIAQDNNICQMPFAELDGEILDVIKLQKHIAGTKGE